MSWGGTWDWAWSGAWDGPISTATPVGPSPPVFDSTVTDASLVGDVLTEVLEAAVSTADISADVTSPVHNPTGGRARPGLARQARDRGDACCEAVAVPDFVIDVRLDPEVEIYTRSLEAT